MSGPDKRVKGLDRERLGLELKRAAKPAMLLVALAVLSIASVMVILTNIGVGLPGSDTYKATVVFDDVAGLVEEKQTVRLAGVEVGRVDEIELADDGAEVTLSIDPEYGPLYADAEVRLRPETPLNDLFVNIEDRGTPGAGELAEDEVLPAQRTRTPVDIGRVLNVFNADTRSRVEQAIDAAGRGLGARGDEFREALVELTPFLAAAKQITQEMAVRREQTSRLIHNFRLVTEELGRRDEDLRRLVSGGAASLGELGQSEAAVQEVLAELPPTMRQLQSSFATLRSTADELDPAFDELQPVAEALPSGLDALERFGAAAEPSFAALRRPVPSLRSLFEALRPTASGLRSSFEALAPVPERLDEITALIPPCEPGLAKFFHNTVSLGKFADKYSVILRGQAVQGFDSGIVNQSAAQSCAPGGPTR